MGQYLSAPVTEKEAAEGGNDAIGYGLAAMQGWRVSMEDAHITELDFDSNTSTSLFSIFDGHGGKAVAKFCARHLARELLTAPAYRAGDLDRALAEAYFRLDVLLDSEEGREDLRRLVGGTTKVAPSLFQGVEKKLHMQEGAGGEDCPGEEEAEGDPPGDPPGNPPDPQGEEAPGPSPGSTPSDGPVLKKTHSEQFMASHLARVSVISAQEGAAGREAPNGDRGGDGGEEEEEEEEEGHHAAGMGCTAVSVLVRGDQVLVANTGDSRCVLSRKGQAIALTLDHKPILFEEAQRIIKAGGFVRDNRINGALNVSRTIGDLDFKRNAELAPHEQMVVATPDVESFTLREGDEFLILACDGIWDVMSNQEAVDFVRKRLKQGHSLQAICEAMCDACLAPDLKGLCRGADNMSVIIVVFRKYASFGGWWSKLVTMCKPSTYSSSSKKAG